MTAEIFTFDEKKSIELECILKMSEHYALNLINRYEGLEEERVYDYPLYLTLKYLDRLNNSNFLESFSESYELSWDHQEAETSHMVRFYIPAKVNFYIHKTKQTLDLTTSELIFKVYSFYIQSFVNWFNETDESNYSIRFQSKKDVRERAMKNNEQDALRLLTCSKIVGFDESSVII